MNRNKEKTKAHLLDQPTVNTNEFCQILGVSRGTFNTLKKAPAFPTKLPLGPRTHRWSTQTIREWMNGDAA